MKITNKHKLPAAIVDFLSRKYYVPGKSDFSVTGLLTPPQILQLKQRHDDKLTEDAMDNIWSVFGTAVHELFDKYENSGADTELRLYVDELGVKIGGQVDHYHEGTITDYKVTSVWSVIYDSRMAEWEKQQNIYAYIFRANGYTVDKIQICAILRDWSETSAQRDSGYPQTPVVMLNLRLWNDVDIKALLHERIKLHLDAFAQTDADLTPCTPEEMWEKPSKFAVMKPGAKRATKVFDSLVEAEDFVSGGMVIQLRPGERTRCERYCPVKDFCHQYKVYKESLNDQADV